ncbi:hypothetical protein [Pseudomonas putida]|uniref:hypothetical protein n=1 Tax=Pseudomonas putida TaxID=303 RepID=UPI002B24C371|nr:hypothetical protein [Pseudomonas putida]
MEVLHDFASFYLRFNLATEILPHGLFGSVYRRLPSPIHTAAELVALLKATNDLMPTKGLRVLTCGTVF